MHAVPCDRLDHTLGDDASRLRERNVVPGIGSSTSRSPTRAGAGAAPAAASRRNSFRWKSLDRRLPLDPCRCGEYVFCGYATVWPLPRSDEYRCDVRARVCAPPAMRCVAHPVRALGFRLEAARRAVGTRNNVFAAGVTVALFGLELRCRARTDLLPARRHRLRCRGDLLPIGALTPQHPLPR